MPGSLYSQERHPVPILLEAGWAQDRPGRVRKISPPPGFDLLIVQPVASHYIDYAIPGHQENQKKSKLYYYPLKKAFLFLVSLEYEHVTHHLGTTVTHFITSHRKCTYGCITERVN